MSRSIHDRLLLLSPNDDRDEPFWGGTQDRYNNATSSDEDQEVTYDSSAWEVLVLGTLVFLLLTCAVIVVQINTVRKQQGQNSNSAASDGNTVASMEDAEEGQSKALGEEDKGDAPMIIVIRMSG